MDRYEAAKAYLVSLPHISWSEHASAAAMAAGGRDALSELVGVSKPTVTRWCEGKATPFLAMQAAVISCVLDRMVYLEDENGAS